MAEITLDGVTKVFPDGQEAVKEMDLEIGDGEFMILVGPSGCGKSTALRMIAGLEDITEGELKIGGEVVNDRAPKDRDVAMVFQNYALYPHMTVRENMGFALKLAGVEREEIERKVEDAAKTLDLSQHLGRTLDAPCDLRPADTAHLEREGHVVVGRHVRVERVVLEDHRDVAVLRRQVVDDLVADPHGAVGDVLEPGDHAERRRLAAARRPDEHDELAVGDCHVEVDDRACAVRIDLADTLERDLRHVGAGG